MIRSRRVALAAIVVVLGLSACGDPTTTAPLADQPKVLQLASSQTGAGAGEAAPAAATVDAVDSKMAFFGPTKFVYDGELPALDAPGASWFFASGQQPDLDRVAKLAAALGAQGEVRALPDDQGGGWAVGPQDYSAAVLTVGSDGMLSWWLSAAPTAAPTPTIACGEVLPIEPDAGTGTAGSSGVATAVGVSTTPVGAVATDVVAPDCALPTPAQPPVGVPTKDEALAKAKQSFADWGYDVNSYQFDEPYADEWGASVNASLLLEGMKAPIMLSVGFGENGAITYASGYLADPQRGDDYPTVGAAAGLERLQTQQNQYIGLDSVNARTSSAGVAASGGAVSDVAIAPGAPTTDVVCEPESANASCAPVPPESVTVALNSVTIDLLMQWAADNTIWLLPAYSFGSADGGLYTVIAVDDAYIQEVDPPIAVSEPAVIDAPGVVTAVAGTETPAAP